MPWLHLWWGRWKGLEVNYLAQTVSFITCGSMFFHVAADWMSDLKKDSSLQPDIWNTWNTRCSAHSCRQSVLEDSFCISICSGRWVIIKYSVCTSVLLITSTKSSYVWWKCEHVRKPSAACSLCKSRDTTLAHPFMNGKKAMEHVVAI